MAGRIQYNHANYKLSLWTQNNERVTLGKNVGIGTTNPDDPVLSTNTNKLSVGIVSCHQLYVNGNEISGIGSSFVLLGGKSATGTEVEFTGIPADAMEITVMFKGVSQNSSRDILVQLGYSSWIASGYVSNSENTQGTDETHSTNGFVIYSHTAVAEHHGSMIINKASSDTYTAIGEFRRSNSGGAVARGSLSSVSGTVERLKSNNIEPEQSGILLMLEQSMFLIRPVVLVVVNQYGKKPLLELIQFQMLVSELT